MTDEQPTAPAPDRPRRGGGTHRALGIVLILVGAWFFIERTLRIDLPAIPWDDLWPVLLIGLGVWIAFRGTSRRST